MMALSPFRPSLEQNFRAYTSGATEENMGATDTEQPTLEEEEE